MSSTHKERDIELDDDKVQFLEEKKAEPRQLYHRMQLKKVEVSLRKVTSTFPDDQKSILSPGPSTLTRDSGDLRSKIKERSRSVDGARNTASSLSSSTTSLGRHRSASAATGLTSTVYGDFKSHQEGGARGTMRKI